MTRSYIVVDLDSTLADNSHREHLAIAKKWDEFHDAMGDDDVFVDAHTMIKAVQGYSFQDIDIIFLTARDEKYRDKTIDWLNNKCGFYYIEMFMRDRPHHEEKAGDFKLRKLKEMEQIRGSKPLFCLEDQMNITLQLRAAGFVVWNVRNSHA